MGGKTAGHGWPARGWVFLFQSKPLNLSFLHRQNSMKTKKPPVDIDMEHTAQTLFLWRERESVPLNTQHKRTPRHVVSWNTCVTCPRCERLCDILLLSNPTVSKSGSAQCPGHRDRRRYIQIASRTLSSPKSKTFKQHTLHAKQTDGSNGTLALDTPGERSRQ